MFKISRGRRLGVQLLGILGTLLLWSFVASMLAKPFLLPSPLVTFSRLLRDVFSPLFLSQVLATLSEAAVGCLLGIAVALPLAYLIYRFPYFAAATEPLLAISQSIPAVVLAPVLVVWVGYGTGAIAVFCAIIVFFPILVATVLGLRSLPSEIIEAARLDGAGGYQLLRRIEAPLALPAVLAGVRTGFTLSATGAVVGEFVMGGSGLGARISSLSASADMAGIFSSIIVLCTLSTSIYLSISTLEHRSPSVDALR